MVEILVIAFLVIVLLYLLFRYLQLSSAYKSLGTEYLNLSAQLEARARDLFSKWREEELESQRRVLEEGLRNSFEAKLKEEMSRREEEIRQDAIRRSASTILGKVGEQLAPLFIFQKYGIEPKDLRFIGSPIDYIAFKGYSDGSISEIVFIEVKNSDTNVLTKHEKDVKEVVESKNVYWALINLRHETSNATTD